MNNRDYLAAMDGAANAALNDVHPADVERPAWMDFGLPTFVEALRYQLKERGLTIRAAASNPATETGGLDPETLADAMMRHSAHVTRTDILHPACTFDCSEAIAAEYSRLRSPSLASGADREDTA